MASPPLPLAAVRRFPGAAPVLPAPPLPKEVAAEGRRRRRAYRMLRSLGSGTQASVRLAGREDTAELFACKSYLKNPSGGEPVALRRELRILERYRHPHVVGFVEHFESKSKHYVVLEFCEGPDLQRYLSMRGGRLPDGEVRAISGTLLRTLFFLHSQGVVHRDLKPANVLIRDIDRPAETLCLADFGSAVVLDEAGATRAEPPRAQPLSPSDDGWPATETSLLVPPQHASSSSASSASSVDTPSPIGLRSLAGTPYYLAPEIVGGRPYDSAVDMWSLGCILYQLIHGHTPFELVTSFADLYRQIGAAQIEFPETAPADLRSFLSGLLQPDPTSRMTASEALAHAWMDAAGECHSVGADFPIPDGPSGSGDGWLVHLNDFGELELSDVGLPAGDSGYGSARGDSLCGSPPEDLDSPYGLSELSRPLKPLFTNVRRGRIAVGAALLPPHRVLDLRLRLPRRRHPPRRRPRLAPGNHDPGGKLPGRGIRHGAVRGAVGGHGGRGTGTGGDRERQPHRVRQPGDREDGGVLRQRARLHPDTEASVPVPWRLAPARQSHGAPLPPRPRVLPRHPRPPLPAYGPRIRVRPALPPARAAYRVPGARHRRRRGAAADVGGELHAVRAAEEQGSADLFPGSGGEAAGDRDVPAVRGEALMRRHLRGGCDAAR